MAGDDYHPDWPLVQWAVNDFAQALGLELTVTEKTESHSYNRYPSWFVTKTAESATKMYSPDEELKRLAASEKKVIAKDRQRKVRRRQLRQLKARLMGKNPQ
jgi:hypothetical protein